MEVNESLKIPNIVKWAKRIASDFFDQPKDDIIIKISLVFVLLFVKSRWYFHYPIRVLAIYMLISGKFSLNKGLWAIIVASAVAINISEWFVIDNHKFLGTYWLFTCFISLCYERGEERRTFLENNATILIGLCFFWATLWKFLGGEFLDGSFFKFVLLADSRIHALSSIVAGFPPEVLKQNYLILEDIINYPFEFNYGRLNSAPIHTTLSYFMSYWTIATEGLMAACFLPQFHPNWKFFRLLYKWRDFLLFYFIVCVYPIFSVSGFNYILFTMGLSQADLRNKRTLYLYFFMLLFTELNRLPWKIMINSVAGILN